MKYKFLKIAFIFLGLLISTNLFASDFSSDDINWFMVIITVFGGLALFLYGMEMMSKGMKKSAGNKMRSILKALSKNRFIGLFVGAFVTMVIQSSSATTVMLVSFVQSGIMQFTQTLSIILGANIGTTVTTQIIAFKLTDFAILFVAIGFFIQLISKKEGVKSIGNTIFGFGLLFYGIKLMSMAMEPLRSYEPFIEILKGLENPVAGIIAGTILTAVIQSSSAFTGILIVLANQQLISLDAAIPMIIGANIGTCFTAFLASLGSNREAKRVAFAHIFFKIAGSILFIFWIPYFTMLVEHIAELLNNNIERQIANAHTIYNVGVALFFIPFTGIISKLLIKIFPQKEERTELLVAKVKYIDSNAEVVPQVAIEQARAEIGSIIKILNKMLQKLLIPFLDFNNDANKKEVFKKLTIKEDKLDFLEAEISKFLLKIGKQDINTSQTKEIFGLLSIINDLERIGDIIHRNLENLYIKKQNLNKSFSKEGENELELYHEKLLKQINRIKEAFEQKDMNHVVKVLQKSDKYSNIEFEYRTKHLERMYHEKQDSINTHEIHMELMNIMMQINLFLDNIAKTLIITTPVKQNK